jgi:hypothetical protein
MVPSGDQPRGSGGCRAEAVSAKAGWKNWGRVDLLSFAPAGTSRADIPRQQKAPAFAPVRFGH